MIFEIKKLAIITRTRSLPISAESPDLELRLCPVRPSEIMNSNINDTVERFLYQKR